MRTGQAANPETTKAPRRARHQRELREGVGSDHAKETRVKVTVHRPQEATRGWCAGEKRSDRNSNNNGRHWFLLAAGFYIHY